MKETVFLNGKFLPKEEALVSVSAPGFLYTAGLFETMRSYNGKIVYLEEHLNRIERSAKLISIKLPFSIPKLKKIIKKATEINGFKDAYIRLTLWKSEKGADILLTVKKYNPPSSQKYKAGFRLLVSSLRQPEGSLFAMLKTTNRLLYQLSLQEAKARGFDDALILNNRGYITEASRSNVFIVNDNELFTPALECGCLDGVTRKVIFALAKKYNIKIYEGKLTSEDLYKADEAFLTNSLMGVMPLVSVEKHPIGRGACGKITEYFMQKYNSLLKR